MHAHRYFALHMYKMYDILTSQHLVNRDNIQRFLLPEEEVMEKSESLSYKKNSVLLTHCKNMNGIVCQQRSVRGVSDTYSMQVNNLHVG